MKKFRNIIHQLFQMQRGEKTVPSNDSLYIDQKNYELNFQHMLPGGRVVVTVFLN